MVNYNEWFYISRWRENSKKNWSVADIELKVLIKSNLTREEAESFSRNNENKKTIVVNMKDDRYNVYYKKQENESEDTGNKR
jgi:hypothetical protein